MILPLFRRSRRDRSINRLYGAIVAQARLPAFYADFGVPDTVEGRLDMIMLHAALLLRRLQEVPELEALGQEVFDRFCQDMDDNLREMGVGDLAVPRQMQRIAGAFYGRAAAYGAALDTLDAVGLVDALRRNIYSDEPAAEEPVRRLAAYVQAAVVHVRRQDSTALSAGLVSFPDPPAAAGAATAP
ncbi:MAG: ubiquinol-cytochrome C chaperone [Rhizobiales bacterium]|nr:ubiquinol-cytochrome C chaperone [Hyphomicrobiales bacterium]